MANKKSPLNITGTPYCYCKEKIALEDIFEIALKLSFVPNQKKSKKSKKFQKSKKSKTPKTPNNPKNQENQKIQNIKKTTSIPEPDMGLIFFLIFWILFLFLFL